MTPYRKMYIKYRVPKQILNQQPQITTNKILTKIRKRSKIEIVLEIEIFNWANVGAKIVS